MIKLLLAIWMIEYSYRVAGVHYHRDRKEKNMTGILIVTHHNLAQAFMETIEMIAGKHEFLDLSLIHILKKDILFCGMSELKRQRK